MGTNNHPVAAPIERFMAFVDRTDPSGCWLWTGAKSYGYGRFGQHPSSQPRVTAAHRFAYEHWVGEIPAGLQLDHLCRVRACVNPVHLEPVTAAENTRRSPTSMSTVHSAKTHCPKGHPYSGENLTLLRRGDGSTTRRCHECIKQSSREASQRRRARAVE